MLNKLIVQGNLTRDPELKYSPNGKAICEFGMAHNEKTAGGEKVMFIDVTVWEKQAEVCSKWLKKGSQVIAEGRLDLDTWEKDGQRRSKHKMTAFQIHFTSSTTTKDGAQSETQPQTQGATAAPAYDGEVPF